jgi:hypothetical protein
MDLILCSLAECSLYFLSGSLFYDAYAVTTLYSVDDKETRE